MEEYQFEFQGQSTIWGNAVLTMKCSFAWKIGTVFMLITLIAIGIPSIAIWSSLAGETLFWLAILCLLTVYHFAIPFVAAYQKQRREIMRFGTVPTDTTRFGDRIYKSNSLDQFTWDYSFVRKIYRFNGHINFQMKDGATWGIKPEEITKGDFQSFLAFLREKCPTLLIIY